MENEEVICKYLFLYLCPRRKSLHDDHHKQNKSDNEGGFRLIIGSRDSGRKTKFGLVNRFLNESCDVWCDDHAL